MKNKPNAKNIYIQVLRLTTEHRWDKTSFDAAATFAFPEIRLAC